MKLLLPFGLFMILVGCKKTDVVFSEAKMAAVDFTIPIDSIKVNPSGYAPLSALVNFASPSPGKTMIVVKGKHGKNSDIEHTFNDNGVFHSIPVVGLYADYANTVDIRLISMNGDTVGKASIIIRTGSLPPNLPLSIQQDIFPNSQVEKGINLVSNFSAVDPHIPLFVDNYGDIRWLLDYTSHPDLNKLNYQDGLKRLRNGNFYFGDLVTSKIYEVDLLGTVLHSWDLAGKGFKFHHEVDEKPDGNFVISVDKTGSVNTNGTPTIEDYIVEIQRQTGDIVTTWDLKESLDENRTAIYEDYSDWIHVNAVFYDSTDNTIIVSGRHQGVVKLSFDNKVKWILSSHRGWKTNRRGENLNQFLLAPLDKNGSVIKDDAVLEGYADHPDFEWCWFQHSSHTIPNGNLLLFDNGAVRNYNESLPKYSRAVEYKIDAVNMTIQQKWQYGKERGLETFSSIVSKAQYLPETDHVLFCPGYQVKNYNGTGGKIVEVDYKTKQIVSQISMSAQNSWGFHRAERISVYP